MCYSENSPPLESKDIHVLIQLCIDYMTENGYKRITIANNHRTWRNGILKFMAQKKTHMYDIQIGSLYADKIKAEKNCLSARRKHLLSIRMLNDMLCTGTIRVKTDQQRNYEIDTSDGDIGKAIQMWLTSLECSRRQPSRIKTIQREMYYFQQFLKGADVVHLSKVKEEHLLSFFKSIESQWTKKCVVCTVRGLFKFLHENGIFTSKELLLFLKSFTVRKNDPLPSVYSADEVKIIESSIERSSSLGKRNWAMVLLASRLCMRASDIANLKFDNIFWAESKIRFLQVKTGHEIELPLVPEVGNAIIDYLKNGRQKSESKHIFLSCTAPYRAATTSMVSSIISRIIKKSGVSINGRHHGPHSLRHSTATSMIENGTIITTISEVLGHRSNQSTMSYIRTDIKTMKKNMLEVPVVSSEFYSQGSNAFYE